MGRMIALNKKFPQIGGVEDYRPIVIYSAVIKFLEGYLIRDLRKYLKYRLTREQFGFVPNVGI